MIALPPEIKFGKVVGRWAMAVADGVTGDQDEYPDIAFPTGSVTFTRLDVNTVLLDTLQNDGTFIGIARKNVVCELGPDGELRLAGKNVGGVWLAVGSWQVTPVIAESNWTAFPIVVEETHTALAPLDLLAWSPIVETPTVTLVASIETALRAESAATRAELAAETAESFAVPTLIEDPDNPGLFDYEQVGEPLTVEQTLVAQDADANSDFRVQQDLRHMSTYVAAGDGLPHKIVAGVLRRDHTLGWQWIDDTIHEPVNGATVTADSSKITVTFPAQVKVNTFNVTIDDYYASLGYSVGASVGLSNALIYCYSPPKVIGGYIRYAGSVWNVSSTVGVNSAAFNTDTGVLTISHNYMTGYAVSVTSRDGIYTPVVTGGGGSSTTVAFFDWAGTRIMVPDTNMKLYFTYSQPAATLDPTAMGTTGNLWCLGVFQSS